jgi:hypothetical protein
MTMHLNAPILGYDYVGAAMSDKSGDKSELPFENNLIAHHSSNIIVPLHNIGVVAALLLQTIVITVLYT